MALSGRPGDPILELIARETYALFPNCHRCGQPIAQFEDAEVRILIMRVVHRGSCPPKPAAERIYPAASERSE
jgi:hypothetical protein